MAPQQGPPAAASKPGVGQWARTHKGAATGIGAVVVGGGALLLYERSKNANANSTTSTDAGSSTDTTGQAAPGTATYADTSGDYDSLESQIAALQSQVSADQSPPPPIYTTGPGPIPDQGGGTNKTPPKKSTPKRRAPIKPKPPTRRITPRRQK